MLLTAKCHSLLPEVFIANENVYMLNAEYRQVFFHETKERMRLRLPREYIDHLVGNQFELENSCNLQRRPHITHVFVRKINHLGALCV